LGITHPLWVSNTLSGAKAPGLARKNEIDTKLELDVQIPLRRLRDGWLTLSLGGEYDDPQDSAHSGKHTISGNVQISADDYIKRDWGSLTPKVQGSIQDQGGQVSGVLKGGVELKIQPWKSWKDKDISLKGDINLDYQRGLSGLDPKQDPKAQLQAESNLTFEVDW